MENITTETDHKSQPQSAPESQEEEASDDLAALPMAGVDMKKAYHVIGTDSKVRCSLPPVWVVLPFWLLVSSWGCSLQLAVE